MKYVCTFLIASLCACLVYCFFIVMMVDAPVPAEYWVAEMITVKKELVKNYTGQKKIIVAGGSSTLFGIDAEYASRVLAVPVINFGLHAGLRLTKLLSEVSLVVEPGDILILALEPPYYKDLSTEPPYYPDNTKLNAWHVTNIIGWDHAAWNEMNYTEKLEFVSLVSPSLFGQMCLSAFLKTFYPAVIADRLSAFDSVEILSKFRSRKRPLGFRYSVYNINNYGDILQTEGSHYNGPTFNVSKLDHMCEKTENILRRFVGRMKEKDVQVYFSNTPSIASGVDQNEIRKSDVIFKKSFLSIGSFIDNREDVIFDRKYFFNTSLHLNADGRSLRTNLFVNALRKSVIPGMESVASEMASVTD